MACLPPPDLLDPSPTVVLPTVAAHCDAPTVAHPLWCRPMSLPWEGLQWRRWCCAACWQWKPPALAPSSGYSAGPQMSMPLAVCSFLLVEGAACLAWVGLINSCSSHEHHVPVAQQAKLVELCSPCLLCLPRTATTRRPRLLPLLAPRCAGATPHPALWYLGIYSGIAALQV